MIFAKLDVCFWRHRKFRKAGAAACGYWAACLAWLREEESETGLIPFADVGQMLGLGQKRAIRSCETLVDCELFERTKDGFVLIGYTSKNESKSAIDARRAATCERVERFRASSRARNAVTGEHVTPPVTGIVTRFVTENSCAFVPGSGSHSDSDLISDQTREAPAPKVVGRPAADPASMPTMPPDSLEVTEAIRAQCTIAGAPMPRPEHVVACLAHYRGQGVRSADWASVLVKWMINQKAIDGRRRSAPFSFAKQEPGYQQPPPEFKPEREDPNNPAVPPPANLLQRLELVGKGGR